MEPTTVAILGLGLIGGSLARDLAAAGHTVLAHDADGASTEAALGAGVLAGVLEPGLEGLAGADIVVLAVPGDAAEALLRRAQPHLQAARLVTDTGSTKRRIVDAALQAGLADRFVGAHPLAGDHRSGWAAARAGLFRGATVYLCPTPRTPAAATDLAERFWRGVGAVTVATGAAAHDRALAWSSHLPQVASSALALALRQADIAPADLGPGGRDATRLAASNVQLWTAIALENRDNLGPAIHALELRLAALRQAIADGDETRTAALLRAAAAWRDSAPAAR
jgi:prephenate dehydrogenase